MTSILVSRGQKWGPGTCRGPLTVLEDGSVTASFIVREEEEEGGCKTWEVLFVRLTETIKIRLNKVYSPES